MMNRHLYSISSHPFTNALTSILLQEETLRNCFYMMTCHAIFFNLCNDVAFFSIVPFVSYVIHDNGFFEDWSSDKRRTLDRFAYNRCSLRNGVVRIISSILLGSSSRKHFSLGDYTGQQRNFNWWVDNFLVWNTCLESENHKLSIRTC